ncbi:ATP-binding protein [Parasphingopyxis sp.]|uniref:ATP-binding protein n=1 Tax=Parasphingopyxis sp. TaxID=1920299 RepID=UPI0026139BDA|nr:ATP-binding protein [Parasphingopyxis sp.]
MTDDTLSRIADALDRIAPPLGEPADPLAHPAYIWREGGLHVAQHFAPLDLALLTGIDAQKTAVLENSRRISQGAAAHDILLWGARGSGKSMLAKSAVAALQAEGENLALIEVASDRLDSLPELFALLAPVERAFILFIDDIGFDGDAAAARALRSLLEGGAEARPAKMRLYVTSNRRHIVPRSMAEQDDPVNPRDARDDSLALSDRFGLSLGFHAASQADYLAMIEAYAAHFELAFDETDAIGWATRRGSRSGRVAWQYIVELAGRSGRSLAETNRDK